MIQKGEHYINLIYIIKILFLIFPFFKNNSINKEMTSSLLIERKKITEMDLKIFKSKDSELFIREKDEQIQDLMNEIKILQQHNSELIALSNKYSNIEIENLQLTSKISDHVNSNEILKNALNNEQANTIALQTANSQLLLKLNELQRNVDTLTIQLTVIIKQKFNFILFLYLFFIPFFSYRHLKKRL